MPRHLKMLLKTEVISMKNLVLQCLLDFEINTIIMNTSIEHWAVQCRVVRCFGEACGFNQTAERTECQTFRFNQNDKHLPANVCY